MHVLRAAFGSNWDQIAAVLDARQGDAPTSDTSGAVGLPAPRQASPASGATPLQALVEESAEWTPSDCILGDDGAGRPSDFREVQIADAR